MQIIAFDFDGTVERKGSVHRPTIKFLQHAKSRGAKLILHTCRGGSKLDEAIKWLASYDIHPDAINDDVEEIKSSPWGQTKGSKPFANIYIDNSAVNKVDELWGE